MFNDDMRMISRSLYLQTRHFRAELLVEGIKQTKILFFGLKYIEEKHWQVADLDLDIDNRGSKESIVDCVYKSISMRFNKDGDHGFFMLIDKDKTFKGVLYGIEGMLAQYISSHEDLLYCYTMYKLEEVEFQNEDDILYETIKGDPICKPTKWDYYMQLGNKDSH